MEESKKNTITTKDIETLSNELTYRRYIFTKDQINNIFGNLNVRDYIALHIIKETEAGEEIYSGRTYLKDLAEKMQLTIRQISQMVGGLKEQGLVLWSHDGDGSEGTYVTITEAGKELLQKDENALKDYYGKVIEKYGKDNMIQLLHLMKQLETVMSSELEGMEVEKNYDKTVE